MKNNNLQQMSAHVDELIEDVEDDPILNSSERHFVHKIHGRDHTDRREVRKALKIYTKAKFQKKDQVANNQPARA
jgi:UDP-3-O-acyl-N-acetylglucosamine deacetylase